MIRLVPLSIAVVLLASALPAAAAEGTVPVRARVMKGDRSGPPRFDDRLADLKGQLSRLAYVRWDQISEDRFQMKQGRTEFVKIPDGDVIAVTVVEVRPPTVTFEVGITQQNTQSRLTIEKGQRIVHQVTRERDGAAYFIAVMPWP